MMQRSLVLLKPDCVERRLMGQVISRFEAKGLNIVAMK
ncbi:MAG: nucleoside-diphosphate kinase, partial [Planctomycetales bacterium]|nr:nucleoside-diphosphate kinase [Planctomycetales bacterium]